MTATQPVRFLGLPASPYAQARKTLLTMKHMVNEAHADLVLRGIAEVLARPLAPRDTRSQAQAVRHYVGAHVKFLRDPTSVEYTKTPRQMLDEIRQFGVTLVDCDDAAVLAAALATVIGLPARFRALRYDGQFLHVIADVWDGGTWVDMDVTKPAQYLPPQPDALMLLEV